MSNSEEILDGIVHPGPPPTDAVRPEAVIRDEDGTVVQAVVRLEDGTVLEVHATDLHPGTFTIEPAPALRWDEVTRDLSQQARLAFGAHQADPRAMFRITGC